MAAIGVGTRIRPEQATCCLGNGLRSRGGGPPWEEDLWECPVCHCALQTSLSGFAPRGWRIVTAISTARCTRHHVTDQDS